MELLEVKNVPCAEWEVRWGASQGRTLSDWSFKYIILVAPGGGEFHGIRVEAGGPIRDDKGLVWVSQRQQGTFQKECLSYLTANPGPYNRLPHDPLVHSSGTLPF